MNSGKAGSWQRLNNNRFGYSLGKQCGVTGTLAPERVKLPIFSASPRVLKAIPLPPWSQWNRISVSWCPPSPRIVIIKSCKTARLLKQNNCLIWFYTITHSFVFLMENSNYLHYDCYNPVKPSGLNYILHFVTGL